MKNNLPGFNAESSLGASAGVYRARSTRGSITETATGLVTPAVPRARWCQTVYRTYISHYFPTTVCETIFPELEVATMSAAVPSSGGQRSTTRSARSFSPDWLRRFQHCRTVALPFIGEVKTTQNCDDSIPDSSVLEVYGHPELTTYWTGGINEIPPPYNPGWFGPVGQTCGCCGTFQQCPDGSCKPRNSSCTQYPV